MKLTPEILAASYSYLRLTLPFRRWKLPPPEEVIFRVYKSSYTYGTAWKERNRPVYGISISNELANCTGAFIETMAHEMVHLYLHPYHGHGAKFDKAARLVCKHHGFNHLIF